MSLLLCKYVNQVELYGLGYGKDILVPFEQKTNGKKGKRYLVYLIWMKNKPFGSFE
jgi:predicted RNA-binding protein (virulence factor B family)